MRSRYSLKGQSPGVFDIATNKVTVGSSPDCDIHLSHPYVAGVAAELDFIDQQWSIHVLPAHPNPVRVNGFNVYPGEQTLVGPDTTLEIDPFTLTLESLDADVGSRQQQEVDRELSQFVTAIHVDWADANRTEHEALDSTERMSDAYIMAMENDIDELARLRNFSLEQQTDLVVRAAGLGAKSELIASVLFNKDKDQRSDTDQWRHFKTRIPEHENELQNHIEALVQKTGIDQVEDLTKKMEQLETTFWPAWQGIAPNLFSDFLKYLGMKYIKKQLKDIVYGLGALEDLLRLPNISEIMAVGYDRIYVEKGGRLEKSGQEFVSNADAERIIERIVQPVNRSINQSTPLVDARLRDGSRVNAIIHPLALDGPSITIRKFPLEKVTIDKLINWRAISRAAARFLEAAVIDGRNILVSGGTGSGKTTMLNCLSDYIPDKDRIVTIEDTAELRLHKEHVVRLESRPANAEGTGEYSIQDLVKNSLRMRPDRIVVGECRSKEALDMLQAMNTGHDGSMTTIHANSARDVVLRLEVLVQQASSSLPVESIRRQIASAIDLVVQLSRFTNGRRIVTEITEFVAYDERIGNVTTRQLFCADKSKPEETIAEPTGHLPTFMPVLIEKQLIDLQAFYV